MLPVLCPPKSAREPGHSLQCQLQPGNLPYATQTSQERSSKPSGTAARSRQVLSLYMPRTVNVRCSSAMQPSCKGQYGPHALLPQAGWGHPAFLSIHPVLWDRQEILTHQKRREQAAPWCDKTRHRGVKNQGLWCRKLSRLAKSSQPHSQIPVTILLPFHSMEAENVWFRCTDFSQSSHFC